MAYIGKTPTIGNFQKCDAITVVNGQAAYTMQVGGSNVSPESENHMLVSLNGILQAPVDSFTISGSTITFASNLATGDVIDFIMLLGNVLDLGTPSDNTVTAAKLNNDIISGQTALTVAPADTDELLISDAGTLKRIDYSLLKSTPGLVHIKTISASNVGSVDFVHGTNDVVFDDTYDIYKFFVYNYIPATDGQNINGRIAISGTFKTDANYDYTNRGVDSSNNNYNNGNNGETFMKLVTRSAGNQSGENYNLELTAFNPGQSSTRTNFMWQSNADGGNGLNDSAYGGGMYESNSAVNGFRFYSNSGNITSGTFALFGISKS